jgi:hypothetical protein
MLILGLLILVGAGLVGTAGVLGNRGAGDKLPGGFDLLGHTMHGSAGQLFFWGIALGAATVIGLILLLAGLRNSMKRRGTARRDARWRRKDDQQSRPIDGAVATAPDPATVSEPATAPEPAATLEPQAVQDSPVKA